VKKKTNHSPQPRHRVTDAAIAQALNEAARDAVELHKQSGIPLAVWKDGKVALVPADEVVAKRKRAKPRRGKSRR
jgi:CubicO group peptidase (beta-lactamase class C family)